MYQRISFGGRYKLSSKEIVNTKPDINERENTLLLPLIILTIILGIYTVILLDCIHISVSTLIYSYDQYLPLQCSFTDPVFGFVSFFAPAYDFVPFFAPASDFVPFFAPSLALRSGMGGRLPGPKRMDPKTGKISPKRTDPKTGNPPKPHAFASIQLQNSFGLFKGFKVYFSKLNIIFPIIFSKFYCKYLISKIFTKKSALVIMSSIVIANIVRSIAIKYGIHTPLYDYPPLFSAAAGITSFLCIPTKITIETVYNILDNKGLITLVDGDNVLYATSKEGTTLKMVDNNRGQSSGTPGESSSTPGQSPGTDITSSLGKIEDLLNELKINIDNAKKEISMLDSNRNTSDLNEPKVKIKDKGKSKLDINNMPSDLKAHFLDIEKKFSKLETLGSECRVKLLLPYFSLYQRVTDLEFDESMNYSKYRSIKSYIKQLVDNHNKEEPKPLRENFDSDEKYIEGLIDYVHKIKDNDNKACSLMKKCVNENVSNDTFKTNFFTDIKKFNRDNTNYTKMYINTYKELLKSSEILKQLEEKTNNRRP